ncbi:MAG: hypothetical protein KatS3mg096_511 [Candidatus Parcubacteria bacterium]|nr:MAG: hypothetical protein KatS3mg093_439 [Candidatus Parcubacteria bacterium]GIW67643.1 MAG: hypothetical protein KatS3mg096_511 [Candidatus Parcubacteria bacterium]
MDQLLKAFGIDFKILIFQVINFFIVFFIIYKFFAKPLGQIIEERRKNIQEGLKLREEAERLLLKIKYLKKKNLTRILEEKRQAKEEVEKFKKERIAEILNEIEELRKKMIAEMEEDKMKKQEAFHQQLKNDIPKVMLKLAEKIFGKQELNEKFILNILNNDKQN